MQPTEQQRAAGEDGQSAPDVAEALCDQLHRPLTYLLASVERANEALRCRAGDGDGAEQGSLRIARCLADVQATAHHLLAVVSEVHGHARAEPRRMRRLDLRAAVRAAAAMVQPGGGDPAITIDAPEAVWVDGIDTRLVHVFVALFADALAEEAPLVARLRVVDGGVRVEVAYSSPAHTTARPTAHGLDELSPGLARAVVRYIVAAHGGRLDTWPVAGPGLACRVTLPSSRRLGSVSPD